MFYIRGIAVTSALLLTTLLQAQSNDFATGNMRMDANAVDVNGDKMISKQEFMVYMEKTFSPMSKDGAPVSASDAAQQFARGNMRFSAKSMDTDHDGMISKAEFMTYMAKKFERMKNANGNVPVELAAEHFATGSMKSR